MDQADIPASDWQAFMAAEGLPAGYRDVAAQWFLPLAAQIIERHRQNRAPLLIGINGCQGSGKSTLAALLEMALPALADLRVAVLSIDDFYLPRSDRQQLAKSWHPLFATRGVPGTHDIPLLERVLRALRSPSGSVRVPRFDKALDDRVPAAEWSEFDTPVDIVIWEGWCLGVPAQPDHSLLAAVNELESKEDPDGAWRRRVNECLGRDFQPLFSAVDLWVMLAAPSFDCVHRWRSEQEAKLRARRQGDEQGLMTNAQIGRFIQFYQRLTEWALATLPTRVDVCFQLDDRRQIQSMTRTHREPDW